MADSLVLLLTILSCLIVLSESTPYFNKIGIEKTCENQLKHHLIIELEEAKLKIARLESILEETFQDLNAKSLYLTENEKLIEEMDNDMDSLHDSLSSLKGESLANETLSQLEEEVRFLWATLRKTNFEIHSLEPEAQDAENRLELVTSQVETMTAIVTEQWIQIQHLEQALHIAGVRELKANGKGSSTKCTFLKMLVGRFSFLVDKESVLGSHVTQALHQLERILSAAKKYHHELQAFIQQEMEKNEFTAALANKEVVFFVASALITFPIMSGWMLLSSKFT